MLSKVKIAILDNGVDERCLYHQLERSFVADNGIVRPYDSLLIESEEFKHGTYCAMIIEKYFPYCSLNSVKILDKEGKGIITNLQPALEWCYQKEIMIVNLSLGTTNYTDKRKIQQVVNKYDNKGMIIIAASANSGHITYPASFSNVFGVIAGDTFSCNKATRYEKGIEFQAPSKHKIMIEKSSILLPMSNSYAAPYITAWIGDIVYTKGYVEKHDLIRIACERNNFCSLDQFVPSLPDWITSAYLVDFRKTSNVNYYFTIIEGKYEAIKSQIDTVIIKSIKELNNRLYRDKKIVYLGKDMVDSNEFKQCVWSRNNRVRQILHTKVTDKKIDIPIVLCEIDDTLDEFEWLCELKDYFGKDGYNAYSISSSEESVLFGLEYIPEELLHQNMIKYVYNFTYWQTYFNQSDLILIVVTSKMVKAIENCFGDWDMLMEVEIRGFETSINIWCEKIVISNFSYHSSYENTIYNSYMKIVEILTEENNDQ